MVKRRMRTMRKKAEHGPPPEPVAPLDLGFKIDQNEKTLGGVPMEDYIEFNRVRTNREDQRVEQRKQRAQQKLSQKKGSSSAAFSMNRIEGKAGFIDGDKFVECEEVPVSKLPKIERKLHVAVGQEQVKRFTAL